MEDALVITPWQFFSRFWGYLDKIDSGINVLINGRRRTYKVERAKDPYKMTKKEYFAMLDESMQQYRDGKYTSFNSHEEMKAWLNSL
jgi:hypothetical protein